MEPMRGLYVRAHHPLGSGWRSASAGTAQDSAPNTHVYADPVYGTSICKNEGMDRNSTRLRLPEALHEHLRTKAEANDVSLNTLVVALLAGAVGWTLDPAGPKPHHGDDPPLAIKPRRSTVPYEADHTGQITFPDHPTSPSLKTHEFETGEPRCKAPLKPWRGLPASYTEQGPGIVDCERCARTHA